ncbi:MAG: hypothetical protein QOH06_4225 [Acidobacteriota bacterium]|jgi:hypothetical protein|nr:hypothetical protein [Acidobacteriota bacterium]
MPEPPNYAFEPQSPRDSGCLRMVLAGLLGVIAGVLLTILVEATVLPGLFDRVHDFFSRDAAAPQAAPVPTEELNEEAKRLSRAEEEMKEIARQKQQELEQDLKKHQEEVEGNR